jgi:hypothetical protein
MGLHLTSLFSTEQLSKQILKKYGKESLIKISEDTNSEGEEVLTITVVKKIAPEDKAVYEKR